jgi:predicted nuclease of predicted toxin-antitoxin system
MRFKTDENLPPELAGLLCQDGHDAVTVWDQNLRGHRDEEIAAVCLREGRAFITMDLGFADIRAYPPEQSPGIVVFRLASQSRAATLAACRRLLPLLQEAAVARHLWIVDEQNVRIRGGEKPE